MNLLATRDGVGPSCVSLPAGPWVLAIDFLIWRFPNVPAHEWVQRVATGQVLTPAGVPIAPLQPYQPYTRLFYYRSVPAEPANRAQETVLFEDELLVVADKPHFLPVMPAGGYLQETLLVRLKRKLNVPGLAPVHRIDRETAGLVLFCKQVAHRPLYHSLFAQRAVHKVYEAIAPAPLQGLQFPLVCSSCLQASEHFMQMRQVPPVPGMAPPAPNAHTTIELLETQGLWARYRLLPTTGKRHQLRVQMAALDLPLRGDRIYPKLLPQGQDDLANPLRLLAQQLQFTDPVTAQLRHFNSRISLYY
jgi:tRNA pseudouridine32 synthase / 23S rRNA pseudouridine746 synthase